MVQSHPRIPLGHGRHSITNISSKDLKFRLLHWPERERDRWRRYLSTQNHPVDVVACAELRELLEVPEPVMPTKEELERKYKRQARYEREKEKQQL